MVATSKGSGYGSENGEGYEQHEDGGYEDGDWVDHDDPLDYWHDDDQVDERASSWFAPRYRLSARVAIAVFGILVLAAVIGVRALYDSRQSDSVDPETGLAWCRDPVSDFVDDPLGDGFGVEGGQACRVEAGQELASSIAAGERSGDELSASGAAPGDGPGSDGEVIAGPPTTSRDGTAPSTTGGPEGDPGEAPAETPGDGGAVAPSGDYQSNLAMIRAQTVRNTTQDDSAYLLTPSAQLVPENHYGPRTEYLGNPGGNPEQDFPVAAGGQFRTGCEFSHFAYDDPIVFPNQPGASHLHMFFGNTDVNAFSTADSLLNSGGATCNGGELNRTGYWAPAMFDGDGNVRIPERIVVYYKGEGLANGAAEPFPQGAAMIASTDLNAVDAGSGGAAGKFSFVCADNFSGPSEPASNTMPACDGSRYQQLYGVSDNPHMVLEMNVKFPQCWNGQDPSNPANFRHPSQGSWYFSQCDGQFNHTLVNLEYFINYRVELGENTSDWYLSSDVDPQTRARSGAGGATIHADWWGGWHAETNQMFLDNCVNFKTSAPSGCGFGYLTNGGPDGNNPLPGPALKYREQYTGPVKVAAADLYRQLCPGGGNLSGAAVAAYCNPASAVVRTSATAAPAGGTSGVGATLFCPVQLAHPPDRRQASSGGAGVT